MFKSTGIILESQAWGGITAETEGLVHLSDILKNGRSRLFLAFLKKKKQVRINTYSA